MSLPSALLSATFAIALIHAVSGPDHYLPFIVLARARSWNLFKTLTVTVACGLAHVLSSIVLGLGGLYFGTSVGNLIGIENFRGDVAAWILISFGLVYLLWSLRKQRVGHVHTHTHFHPDGEQHMHEHEHRSSHAHVHGFEQADGSFALGTLFIIFLLGPCEPLIPLIMASASESTSTLVLTMLLFSIVTIGCMVVLVTIGYYGLRTYTPELLVRYAHPLAGAALMISGVLALAVG